MLFDSCPASDTNVEMSPFPLRGSLRTSTRVDAKVSTEINLQDDTSSSQHDKRCQRPALKMAVELP